ncbi:MAG TPA: hypothetical protein VII56_20745 [Rhizomicrobium sp.]
MNDAQLDELLSAPLPERDAGEFSVTLMEAIARAQSRPARVFSWITIGVLTAVIAAAAVYGAAVASHAALGTQPLLVPVLLTLLTLLLSYVVFQAARD